MFAIYSNVLYSKKAECYEMEIVKESLLPLFQLFPLVLFLTLHKFLNLSWFFFRYENKTCRACFSGMLSSN